MSEPNRSPLAKLSRSELAIQDPLGDVRGRLILTVNGEYIGTVVDLLIDPTGLTIRFLEIDAERIDGFGRQTSLIPVQAVERVDELHVVVGCTREAIVLGPMYNPHVLLSDLYLQEVSEHFGYPMPDLPGTEPSP